MVALTLTFGVDVFGALRLAGDNDSFDCCPVAASHWLDSIEYWIQVDYFQCR